MPATADANMVDTAGFDASDDTVDLAAALFDDVMPAESVPDHHLAATLIEYPLGFVVTSMSVDVDVAIASAIATMRGRMWGSDLTSGLMASLKSSGGLVAQSFTVPLNTTILSILIRILVALMTLRPA
jgi:hypothetical protein